MAGSTAGMMLLILLVGCGGQEEYVVSDLSLHRDGWEALHVEADFAQRTFLGRSIPAEPDSAVFQLFGAGYDTIQTSTDPRLAIPDERLGSLERLIVEVCGSFGQQSVCEQTSLQASPKRVRAEPAVTYPEEGDFERGTYDVQFVVERQRYGRESWERIRQGAGGISAYLMAYVGGREQDAVKIPLRGAQGRFDLARQDDHEDFSFHLNSRLYEKDSARVFFELYAGLKGDPTPASLATLERKVRTKRPEEHREDVRYYVSRAAEEVIKQLTDSVNPNARVHVREWSYSNITQQYQVDMEMRWQAGAAFFFNKEYRLRGGLRVRRGGHEAQFQFKEASGRARKLWNQQVSDRVLRLGSLEAPEKEQGTGPERRLHTSRPPRDRPVAW